MVKPSNFKVSTDFATLKNDTSNTVQITVPASTVIPANSYVEFYKDLEASVSGSIVQLQVGDTYLGEVLAGNQVIFHHDTASPYDVFCVVYRPNATTLRALVYIPNPYGTNTTGLNQNVVYTFYIDTYLPPFS